MPLLSKVRDDDRIYTDQWAVSLYWVIVVLTLLCSLEIFLGPS
jgi:hypothetical protein